MLKELEFPFDEKEIIRKKIKLKRLLLDEDTKRIKKNIAVLGGSTTNDIKLCIELFLLNYGIEPSFYECEYNQFYQESMFPSDELKRFEPDIIYICTTNRNVLRYPDINDSQEAVTMMQDEQFNRFRDCWENLKKEFKCPIIQNNFEKPFYRLLGNKDTSDFHGKVNFLTELNNRMIEYAREHEDFFICDIDYIAADYGLSKWHNLQNWYMYKYAMDLQAIPYLSFNVANIVKSIFGKNKKGYVLDLDNTLWGGVIGDDGINGIEIGHESAKGQAFYEFQCYLKEQTQLGIILNVNSKNDEDNAIAGLNHPEGVLRPQDMIVIKSNWNPKSDNYVEIADELCLLPESLVFVDDNPAERHIIKEQLNNVCTPEIEKVQDYIKILDKSGFFETTHVSADDTKRNQMYKENAARNKLQSSFSDYRDYLLSLEMKAEIKNFDQIYLSRIAQLTNKSNQFNLTTRRYTIEEIEEISHNDGFIAIYGKLKDRFGDNGVVSVVIGRIDGDTCHIELWLMSCRVLKRNFEYAMMDYFVNKCCELGVLHIIGYYYKTEKNNMVKDFYQQFGFKNVSNDGDNNTIWQIDVKDYDNMNDVMDVNR